MRIVQLQTGAFAILVLGLGLVGCHKTSPAPAAPAAAVSTPTPPVSVTQEPEGEPWPIVSTEFLDLIPADTPYVLAQTDPIPADVVRKLQPLIAPLVAAADEGFAKAMKETPPEHARALEEIFGGPPSVAGLEKVGFDLNPRFVVYGLGFTPVFRVRLLDAAAAERAIDRLDALGKTQTKVASFHGQRYRYDEQTDGSLSVLAIVGPDLVFTLLPAGEIQRDLLPLAFGQKVPAKSMAADNRLAQVRTAYGFGKNLAGYVDVQAIWFAMVGHGDDLNRRVAAAYPSFVESRSAECVTESLRLARAFPRVVYGYDELSAKRIVASTVLEVTPEIAKQTKAIPGPIPGLGGKPKPGTLATFGVGIDMKAVERAAVAFATAIRAEPFRCPEFASFNQLGEMIATAPALVPKPLLGVTGFGVQLDDVETRGGDPRIDGVIVVGVADPHAALDAVAKLVPTLEVGKLKKARTPVRLVSLVPDGGTPPTTIADSWIAFGKRSIGVSFGNASKRELMNALDRERRGDRELAVWTVDLAPWMARHPESFDDMKDPNARKLAEAMLALLGDTAFAVRMTDRGMETEVTLDLRKR